MTSVHVLKSVPRDWHTSQKLCRLLSLVPCALPTFAVSQWKRCSTCFALSDLTGYKEDDLFALVDPCALH